MTLTNNRLSLTIELGDRVDPCRILDRKEKLLYADEGYSYALTLNENGKELKSHALLHRRHETIADPKGGQGLLIEGVLDFGPDGPKDIVLRQELRLLPSGPSFEETISLTNTGTRPYAVKDVAFGFRKIIFNRRKGNWAQPFEDFRLSPVPHRRRFGHRTDRRVTDYSLPDLLPHMWEDIPSVNEPDDRNLPDFGSEGWVWTDGRRGMLVLKYQPRQIEFSLFKGEIHTPDFCARFGGVGLWRGDPEAAQVLEPGKAVQFGVSHYELIDGGWKEGCYAFRAFLRSNGMAFPKTYDPPVHWNELYNLSWRLGDGSTRYTLAQLYREAEIAKDIGCEALYLDPGWDTVEGSTIWDEKQLGITLGEFVKTVKDRYGLKTALHLMSNTNSKDEYPGMYRKNAQGGLVTIWNGAKVCTQSAWKQEKTRRLLTLARQGVCFFMFDFQSYYQPCHDPGHGHEIPLRRQSHADGLDEVMRNVKREFPGIYIEAHDRVTGGMQDYHPLYYQYDPLHSFDENWGFEYMWDSYLDLVSGKAVSLYEYNLACEVPLYLHINIGQKSGLLEQGRSVGPDSSGMLAFWWYASTVRHLGIGGVSDPASPLYTALKKAMKTYMSLIDFYKRGTFYGIDEMTHVHTLAGRNQAVINLFNLTGKSVSRDVTVPLAEVGLESFSGLSGAEGRKSRGGFTFTCELKALSQALVKVNGAGGKRT